MLRQAEGDEADGHEGDATPAGGAEALLEQRGSNDRHNYNAQLVESGNARSVAGTQSAEIADPRGPGGEAGQDEEEPNAPAPIGNFPPPAGRDDKDRDQRQDDDGADELGDVGIDVVEPDFGEDRHEGGKSRGADGPEKPAFGEHRTSSGVFCVPRVHRGPFYQDTIGVNFTCRLATLRFAVHRRVHRVGAGECWVGTRCGLRFRRPASTRTAGARMESSGKGGEVAEGIAVGSIGNGGA